MHDSKGVRGFYFFSKKQQKRANNYVRPLMIFIEIRFVISLQIVLFL